MNKEIIIYTTEDGKAKINLQKEHGTVWLSQAEIAELFQTTKQNISKHIKAIFDDGELYEASTVNHKLTVQNEGQRTIQRKIAYYSLDMILAIGYRVRSVRGVQFRNYATTILKEYIVKGFAIDDDRLKNLGGGNYFKELLDRIRDIRSSEKVFYRQVLDLFATSIDYNANTEEAKLFFATVQNKMHYAIHNHTAPELIYGRVDSEKELKSLNNLVSGYLDFAERQAEKEIPMTMKDWIAHVDKILEAAGENLLTGSGKISQRTMENKVENEYKKYSMKTLSRAEKDYLNELKRLENLAKKGGKEKL